MPATTPQHATVADRLRFIADHFGQAEMARRTSVSRQNVNRYLRGTQPSLAYGTDLVNGLGVNPAWLLTGEGVPMLADMAEGAGNLAGDLLDVVNALNAVTRMRIGSLGGKHHLKTLRELGDAMARYDELRSRLNRHSVPILRSVLDDLRRALDRPEVELARSLRHTAEQLGRFCDDEDLALEFTLLNSRLELLEENAPRALELTRKAIVLMFHHGGLLGEREFEVVVESVTALHKWVRFSEALRVAQAAFALAAPETRQSQAALWLEALVASMQVHTGELNGGLSALARVRGRLTGLNGLRTDGMMAQALLYSGAIDIRAAIAFGGDLPEKAERILGFAASMEDAETLERAASYWDRLPHGHGEFSFWIQPVKLMLRALRGDGRKLGDDIRSFAESAPGLDYLLPFTPTPIVAAQIYRLKGDTRNARRQFEESCRVIASLPDWFSTTVMWNARHMRNALELGNAEQKRSAADFFRRHVELGYRCFTALTK
jgi:hypothetical protein